MIELQINNKFKSIFSTVQAEKDLLEKNILKDGIREPIAVWNGTILDGHTRYDIAVRHNVPFETIEMNFADMDEAELWIRENQAGKRNLSDEMRTYNLGVIYELRKKRHGGDRKSSPQNDDLIDDKSRGNSCLLKTAKIIAKENGVSKATVERAAQYARAIDSITNDVPEFKEKVLSGELGFPQKEVVKLSNEIEGIKQSEPETNISEYVDTYTDRWQNLQAGIVKSRIDDIEYQYKILEMFRKAIEAPHKIKEYITEEYVKVLVKRANENNITNTDKYLQYISESQDDLENIKNLIIKITGGTENVKTFYS